MANAYDEIAYPAGAFRQTHPDRLAAHATLFGLAPASPVAARVLEIGASDGANLIPMALGAPGARFVGFDLADAPVRRGNEIIAALGLANVRLFQADIREVDFGGETFDYIIAQGIWSWVPPDVRAALMRLIGERLAPHGVAFVSFNAFPGGHLRLAVRQELLFAARGEAGLTARMQAAMRALQAWPAPSAEKESFRRAMAEEAGRMRERSLGSLTHDELNEFYHPALLSDYAAEAARHGLRILAGADQRELTEWTAPLDAPDGPEADGGLLERAQQADFQSVRFYREPLLVRAEAPLARRPRPEFVARLHVASEARRVSERTFQTDEVRFDLHDSLLASVLERLASIWPSTAPAAAFGLDAERLLALVRLHETLAVELRGGPSRFAPPGDRPTASPLARLQASQGETRLTTLLHTMRDVDDEFSRGFIASLDGTRTRAEIARAIAPRFNLTGEAALAPLGVLLDLLARAPLLVA